MTSTFKPTTVSRPLPLRNATITDAFWKHQMELVRKEVIPYQWNALNDNIPDAAPSFCMRNFKVAGKITQNRKMLGKNYQEKIWPLTTFETLPEDMNHMEDRFYGFLFQDSDFAKWIEAVGYSLTQYPDPELEAIADGAIDIVCEAQQENGYLDTYYIINDMSQIFTNLRDNHELYCFGHLTEGAVAYYQATGKDKLLNAVKKYADFIYQTFGPDENKLKGYPGHEIAEMALVRLYEVTGEKKYLDLCNFFLNQRGVHPYYYDQENPKLVKKVRKMLNVMLTIRRTNPSENRTKRLDILCVPYICIPAWQMLLVSTVTKKCGKLVKPFGKALPARKCTLPAVSAAPISENPSPSHMTFQMTQLMLKPVHPSV